MLKKISDFKNLYFVVLIFLIGFTAVGNAAVITNQVNERKVVQIAVTNIPKSFSPYLSKPLSEQYSHLFFDPLIRWGETKELEFRLISTLKEESSNNIIFYLKKDIYFHSGNSLTSKDVVWSVNEALKNRFLALKQKYSIQIKAINKHQFQIKSKLSKAQLLDYLTHIFILDHDYYQKNNLLNATQLNVLSFPIKTLPISGTGPYKISSYSPAVNFQVEENPLYWGEKPQIKKINFMKIKSLDSRLYALLANDVDISEAVSNKYINSLELGNKDIYQVNTINAIFLAVNTNESIFNREIARNALHLSINQSGMLKHILDGTGYVEDIFKVDKEHSSPPVYDVTRSKTILKNIEGTKQIKLLMMADDAKYKQEVVSALVNMFKKVGLFIEITEVNSIEQWQELESQHDLLLTMWRSTLMEESNVYQDIFSSSLLSGYFTREFDGQKRRLTMEDKTRIFYGLQNSDKIIPLFSKNKIWATDKHYNLNNVFSINGIPYWYQLSLSKG